MIIIATVPNKTHKDYCLKIIHIFINCLTIYELYDNLSFYCPQQFIALAFGVSTNKTAC